ncbi:hypothetical protein MMC28_007045 [Mycoblastus sanguinarius]|nr:hypothetical protein [Mycoblastus sanguinarius]
MTTALEGILDVLRWREGLGPLVSEDGEDKDDDNEDDDDDDDDDDDEESASDFSGLDDALIISHKSRHPRERHPRVGKNSKPKLLVSTDHWVAEKAELFVIEKWMDGLRWLQYGELRKRAGMARDIS